jgi:hypothetical protein
MKHRSYIPVIEHPAAPMAIAPVAESLEAPLLAMMFHLLEGRDRWRSLPILRLWTHYSPTGPSKLSAPSLPAITWVMKGGKAGSGDPLKTAKALELTLSPSFLARADIERARRRTLWSTKAPSPA